MSWSLPETVCWECPERGLELVHLNSECVSPRVRLPRKPGQPCPRPIPALPVGSSTVSGSVFPPRAIRASPSHLITGVLSDFLGLKKAFIAFGSCGWWSQSLVHSDLASCPDFPVSPFLSQGLSVLTGEMRALVGPSPWSLPAMAFLHPPGRAAKPRGGCPCLEFERVTVQVWVNGPPAPSQLDSLFPCIIFLSS